MSKNINLKFICIFCHIEMSMDPFNCRDFVKEIKQQVDDEQFIVNIHKYIETYRQYIPIVLELL